MKGRAQIIHDEVYIRVWFEQIGNCERFQAVRRLFLTHFPEARWDHVGKTWVRLISRKGHILHFSKKVFGVTGVMVHDSTTERGPRQLRLF
ncbi:MAG: hypothetical protein KIT87_12005 [Anaerolineae bacterium]|nr:hypothetical protein [Anaerolineae bacterium]